MDDNTATDQVSFKIITNNTALSGEYSVISLEVDKSCNRISSAKIVLADGDPAKQDFAISSKDDSLMPGSELELQLGYHSKLKTIFKGVIVKQSIKSGKNKKSVLIIEAKDKLFVLTVNRKSQNFSDKTDSDIIKAIAKQSGFSGVGIDVADIKIKHTEMMQYNASDWDFIVSRAEMNSMLVFTDDNKLVVKKPNTSQDAVCDVTFGADVIEIEGEMDGRTQLKEVHSNSWDFKEQKVVDTTSSSVEFAENGNTKGEKLANDLKISQSKIFHGGSLKTDELKAWGDAFLLRSRMAKITGGVLVKGRSDIKPGQMINLKGFSKRFNGKVYVTSVSHNYSTSIWETSIRFGLTNAHFYQKDNIIEKPAAGLLPGVTGLQIGVVIQIDNDPDKEDRVKIKLPMVDEHEGLWARVSSTDAGKNRGTFFRPEMNDEVIVGFLNDDPRHPIILGMLHSSNKPAPLQAKSTNDEKGIVTRSAIKLIFNDTKKSIHMETPKGKKMTIDDDADSIVFSDQNNNKITMDANGITIESPKNIMIKTSGGDVKLEALNINHSAHVKFSAKGNAGAELRSTGQTVVKGAIININ